MILLLNYLPWIIVILALLAVRKWPKRRNVLFIAAVCLVFLAALAGNSGYIPKGTVAPLSNPAFDSSTAEVQDRLRKPERDSKESAEHLKELSDWRKHNAVREQAKQGEQQ